MLFFSPLADIEGIFCLLPFFFFFFCRFGIAAIAPFSHRLDFDNLPSEIQHLRCKVNFQALVYVPHVNALGEALVQRLRHPVQYTLGARGAYIKMPVDGKAEKFVVLHLRFDKVSAFCGTSYVHALMTAFVKH